MGVGQAASAIGGYQSQVAQTDARNRQLANSYNQKRISYEKGNLDRLALQQVKEIDVEIDNDAIGLDTSRAIASSTAQEEDAIRKLEDKAASIDKALMKGTGKASEGGRSRSFERNILLKAGQAKGSLEAQRGRLRVAGYAARREAIEQANRQRINNWRKVNLGAGEAGPAPEMPKFLKGPSKLGLGIQLAGAALTAAAPMFKGSPKPTPGPSAPALPDVSSVNSSAIVTEQGLNFLPTDIG